MDSSSLKSNALYGAKSGLPSRDYIREEYPATKRAIYMDVANQGLISKTTRSSVEPHLKNRLEGINDEPDLMGHVEETRARIAHLINSNADEVAITKNASESINIIANAIQWKPGDNVVLCPSVEHANNILPWLQIRDRFNVELRFLESDRGFISVDSMIRAIDDRTKVVTVSTVTMVPGFKTDIPPIADACKRVGAFLLADASQSVGILTTDVLELGVDGLVASFYKGLMGLYGLGFLYCRKDWADRLNPAYLARFSIDLGDAPESASIDSAVKLRDGAPRFDIGHYNFPGVIAGYSSMEQLMGIGVPAIEQHVLSVSRHLIEGLAAAGLPVCGGASGTHISSLVSVGNASKIGGTNASTDKLRALHEHFTKHQVITSMRRGMLRFSLHFYNSLDEADQVIDLTNKFLSRS